MAVNDYLQIQPIFAGIVKGCYVIGITECDI